MCENILTDTLCGRLQVQSLIEWLKNQKHDDYFKQIQNKSIYQTDFISFFLNYVHEIQTSVQTFNDTVSKTSTPERLENNSSSTCFTQWENSGKKLDISKLNKTPDQSYTNPISPLYYHSNLTTPKDKPTIISPRITPTLCLGDFLVNRKDSSKKKVKRNLYETNKQSGNAVVRRINPTSITENKCNDTYFNRSENNFIFTNKCEEITDASNQRSFFVDERLKIIARDNLSCTSAATLNISKPVNTNFNNRNEIIPSPRCVTFQENLEVLISIYSTLLNESLIVNMTNELYFLISVLLAKQYENDDGVELLLDFHLRLLKNIHNQIYFATRVLEKQIKVLTNLDRATLRLLLENKRLLQFTNQKFQKSLLQIYERKSEELPEILQQIPTNVCFISDTDNRDNFPSDISFHAFRKQRDLFYEILRIWENNHLQNKWDFTIALGGKIKILVNMHGDPANFVHLTRLFKAQLLMNTCGSRGNDENVNENQLSFLSTIPNLNTEKLLRLKSRIVSKQTFNGLNTVPTFTGYQEFYRDFILVAASYSFNKHLSDALISQILELNDAKSCFIDMDDINALPNTSLQKSYLICVTTLRILAKFLAFLDSIPYKTNNTNIPQKALACQINVRDKLQPNINLKMIITNAVLHKSLILTIPWLTEYLAMLDGVTLQLTYFQEILCTLYEIYYFSSNYEKDMTISTIFLIKFCLGWLFELPQFLQGQYYTWLSQVFNNNRQLNFPVTKSKSPAKKSSSPICLDKLEIVNQSILHACCPYLQEIKKILSIDASVMNNVITVKHITPVTAIQSPTNSSSSHLQNLLEQAFFSNQPVSVRKTIEFISERIASTCVKEICNEIVPAFKVNVVAELENVLKSSELIKDSENSTNIQINEFSHKSLLSLKALIDDKISSMMKSRIMIAVPSLLATDVLEQTKVVCVAITTRICRDRVQQWINSHINIGIFSKDFEIVIRKLKKQNKQKCEFELPSLGRDVKHNPSAICGVKLIENIRDLSLKSIENSNIISEGEVVRLLNITVESIKGRCDLNNWNLVLINKMLLDLIIVLMAYQSNVMSEEILKQYILVWKESSYCIDDDLFKGIICTRNVVMLMNSSLPEVSWMWFQQFLDELLQNNFLIFEMFEIQMTMVLNQISDMVTLKYFTNCIKSLTNKYKLKLQQNIVI